VAKKKKKKKGKKRVRELNFPGGDGVSKKKKREEGGESWLPQRQKILRAFDRPDLEKKKKNEEDPRVDFDVFHKSSNLKIV